MGIDVFALRIESNMANDAANFLTVSKVTIVRASGSLRHGLTMRKQV